MYIRNYVYVYTHAHTHIYVYVYMYQSVNEGATTHINLENTFGKSFTKF